MPRYTVDAAGGERHQLAGLQGLGRVTGIDDRRQPELARHRGHVTGHAPDVGNQALDPRRHARVLRRGGLHHQDRTLWHRLQVIIGQRHVHRAGRHARRRHEALREDHRMPGIFAAGLLLGVDVRQEQRSRLQQEDLAAARARPLDVLRAAEELFEHQAIAREHPHRIVVERRHRLFPGRDLVKCGATLGSRGLPPALAGDGPFADLAAVAIDQEHVRRRVPADQLLTQSPQ
ncbi:MAG: hypothetical protein MZV70_39665 [Desulfobacterales bacterium]|nr:hypothetical protein [Desulfobacterales bacterium]